MISQREERYLNPLIWSYSLKINKTELSHRIVLVLILMQKKMNFLQMDGPELVKVVSLRSQLAQKCRKSEFSDETS